MVKVLDQNRAMTKRDLINKLAKVEKALGVQAQRADKAEREIDRLVALVWSSNRLLVDIWAATRPNVGDNLSSTSAHT